MKIVVTFLSTWLLVSVMSAATANAGGSGLGTAGEDPFPLQCVDFSGSWRADNGTTYKINQEDCKHLTIQMHWNNYTEDTISIVPDNRPRAIPGMTKSAIRHRWNSNKHGSVIETHRTWVEGINKVTEVVMYERATNGLLLETIYTTVECINKPGQVSRDYGQQVFRRVAGSTKPDGQGQGVKRTKR